MNREDLQNMMPSAAIDWLMAKYPSQSSHLQRIRAQIDTQSTPGCWNWTGYMQGQPATHSVRGFPCFCIKGRKFSVRRWLYMLITEKDWEKKTYCVTTCGNPFCLNPTHWEIISAAEHSRRIGDKRWENHQSKVKPEPEQFSFLAVEKDILIPRVTAKKILQRCNPNAQGCKLFPCNNGNVYGRVGAGWVHRVVFEAFYGRKVTAGHVVTRTCGNKNCCEITHLREVTYAEYLGRGREERKAKADATM